MKQNILTHPFPSCPPVADVNVAVRKIAKLLKPDKEIIQDGDHMIIKTLSTFRNYNMEFHVGKEFHEDLAGIDDRKCMVPGQTFIMCNLTVKLQPAGSTMCSFPPAYGLIKNTSSTFCRERTGRGSHLSNQFVSLNT